jgi:hypothetical protein
VRFLHPGRKALSRSCLRLELSHSGAVHTQAGTGASPSGKRDPRRSVPPAGSISGGDCIFLFRLKKVRCLVGLIERTLRVVKVGHSWFEDQLGSLEAAGEVLY